MMELLFQSRLFASQERRKILTVVTVLGMLFFAPALRGQTNLMIGWDASTNPYVIGYVVYESTDGVTFTNQLYMGTNVTLEVSNLVPETTVYFEVDTYSAYLVKSAPSKALAYYVTNTPVVVTNSNNPSTNVVENTNSVQVTNSLPGTNTVQNTNNLQSTNIVLNPCGYNIGDTNGIMGSVVTNNTNTAFALMVGGNGTLWPASTVKHLQDGKKYSLTAVPGKGSVFADWSSNGIVVATTPRFSLPWNPTSCSRPISSPIRSFRSLALTTASSTFLKQRQRKVRGRSPPR